MHVLLAQARPAMINPHTSLGIGGKFSFSLHAQTLAAHPYAICLAIFSGTHLLTIISNTNVINTKINVLMI